MVLRKIIREISDIVTEDEAGIELIVIICSYEIIYIDIYSGETNRPTSALQRQLEGEADLRGQRPPRTKSASVAL